MKIAAASCTKLADDPDQVVWTLIRREQPDVLVLMGDNVYLKRNTHTDPVALEKELDRCTPPSWRSGRSPRCWPT